VGLFRKLGCVFVEPMKFVKFGKFVCEVCEVCSCNSLVTVNVCDPGMIGNRNISVEINDQNDS